MSGYREEARYWEAVILLRRVALAAVTVVLAPSGSAVQFKATGTVMVLALAANAWIMPYAAPSLHLLESASLLVITLSFALASFLQPAPSAAVSSLISAIIIGFNVVFIVTWIVTAVHASREKMEQAAQVLRNKPVVGSLMGRLSLRSVSASAAAGSAVKPSQIVRNPIATTPVSRPRQQAATSAPPSSFAPTAVGGDPTETRQMQPAIPTVVHATVTSDEHLANTLLPLDVLLPSAADQREAVALTVDKLEQANVVADQRAAFAQVGVSRRSIRLPG